MSQENVNEKDVLLTTEVFEEIMQEKKDEIVSLKSSQSEYLNNIQQQLEVLKKLKQDKKI